MRMGFAYKRHSLAKSVGVDQAVTESMQNAPRSMLMR
jgi:hypothetical protein